MEIIEGVLFFIFWREFVMFFVFILVFKIWLVFIIIIFNNNLDKFLCLILIFLLKFERIGCSRMEFCNVIIEI